MQTAVETNWSTLRRVAFRFGFSYWALYLLPVFGSASPLDVLPVGAQPLQAVLAWPLQYLALWVGVHLFHLTGIAATWHPTGSGDTALTWVLDACVVALATLATVVWSALDWQRPQYRTLAAWLRLALAVTCGLALMEYGFVKIFPSQFGPPGVGTLTETYGDSTPMRLLWTFMGASTAYTAIAGLGEAVGGLLLLFRRTRTAGALLSGAILFNIVLLNLFYDVPVKLYSMHLLLMCAWILLPDVSPLYRLFFLRQQVQLRTDGVPAPQRPPLRIAARVVQALVLLCALWSLGWQQGFQSRAIAPGRSPLFGAWRVDQAVSTTPQTPWVRVLIARGDVFNVRLSDGSSTSLNVVDDVSAQTFRVRNKGVEGILRYRLTGSPKPRSMVLDGTLGRATVHLELTRVSPDSFLLERQGFHWVHEDSPNR